MLNYILPPIIIIISVAALIMFLFRKAKQIPMQELIAEKSEREQQKEKRTSAIMSAIGQFFLRMMEKVMQKIKLSALKLHNVSNDWFHSIREKRQNRALIQQQEAAKSEAEKETKVEKMDADVKIQKTPDMDVQVQKPVRPLIRETMVRPQTRIREKNQLEEVLIKRIAINPRDIEAYERLGDYYLECTNYNDSLECFKQVLTLSPAHHKAKLRIRKIEGLMGR